MQVYCSIPWNCGCLTTSPLIHRLTVILDWIYGMKEQASKNFAGFLLLSGSIYKCPFAILLCFPFSFKFLWYLLLNLNVWQFFNNRSTVILYLDSVASFTLKIYVFIYFWKFSLTSLSPSISLFVPLFSSCRTCRNLLFADISFLLSFN